MTFDVKTGKPIPAAAKDQPKVSADGKTYTYTVRDGLKYSDGKASRRTTSSTDGSGFATQLRLASTRSPATSWPGARTGTAWIRRRTTPRSSRQRRPRSSTTSKCRAATSRSPSRTRLPTSTRSPPLGRRALARGSGHQGWRFVDRPGDVHRERPVHPQRVEAQREDGVHA